MTQATTALGRVSADDLLVLLSVARLGKFTSAADALGFNHTTVSRRIAALEKALGGKVLVQGAQGWELTALGQSAMKAAENIEGAMSTLGSDRSVMSGTLRLACPEGFSMNAAVPAAVDFQRAHPGVNVEIFTVTQRALHHRSGLDLEIVVEEPLTARGRIARLQPNELGLFATPAYLDKAGTPSSVADLSAHTLIYYVESALHVNDLDEATRELPRPARRLSSTSIFNHLAATEAGGGIGLLPTWLGRRSEHLVRVVPEFSHSMHYWAVIRPESARSPLVAEFLTILGCHVSGAD